MMLQSSFMKKLFFALLFVITGIHAEAQIGLGVTTPHPNAYFQINSTNKGVLLPRMTAVQRIAISPAATANGLIVFDTDSSSYMFWTGTLWKKMGGDDGKSWSLNGNLNTNPPSSVNSTPINYTTDTYLGTPDAKDVSFIAGGNELLRLKQFATGGRIGLANRNPEYSLDIRATEINNETQIQGMRLIAKPLFDMFSTSNADKGLVLGYNPDNVNEMAVWNHANNINGSISFGLDVFNNSISPAFSITGTGQGINQRNPLYFLDIHSQSQFATANNNALNKNGIRISYPNQGADNDMQRGLLMGLATNGDYKSYIWNYDDGSGFFSPAKSILFGIGTDNNRPTIQMQDGILAFGHVKNGTVYPSVLNIQTDYAHLLSKKGISIIDNNLTNDELAYTGLDETGNLELSKFISGDITLNTSGQNRMIIKAGGNVGIGNITPVAPLSFNSSLLHQKISFWDAGLNNVYGIGMQAGLLQIHAAFEENDIAFGYGSSSNFNERMRIKGNGNVGIGNTDPGYILDINNRMRIRSGGNETVSAGIWLNRNDNAALQSFIGNETDNTVGFYGSGSGWSFTMNTNTGKIKIADGTQAAGRILSCDATGTASWVNSTAITSAVTGVFAGGGTNLTTAMGAAYLNTYIDLPPGKWIVLGTYLLSQGGSGGPMLAGQSMWVRTFFSSSNVANVPTGDIIGSGLMSGSIGYPSPFAVINGQNIVNNTSGTTKRYYVWGLMSNTGGQPAGFSLDGLGSNFWSENQLTAVPMN